MFIDYIELLYMGTHVQTSKIQLITNIVNFI